MRYKMINEAMPDYAMLPGDIVDDSEGPPILIRKLTPAAHREVQRRAEEGQTVEKKELPDG